jgi:hypothetical protein
MPRGYDTQLALFIDGERLGPSGRSTHTVLNRPRTDHIAT